MKCAFQRKDYRNWTEVKHQILIQCAFNLLCLGSFIKELLRKILRVTLELPYVSIIVYTQHIIINELYGKMCLILFYRADASRLSQSIYYYHESFELKHALHVIVYDLFSMTLVQALYFQYNFVILSFFIVKNEINLLLGNDFHTVQ